MRLVTLSQITPGALVVAGDEDTTAVCQVVDLVPAGDATIVHLRLLPGLVDDYRALVDRALASQLRPRCGREGQHLSWPDLLADTGPHFAADRCQSP